MAEYTIVDAVIAAITDFEQLPIPGGVFELDGTIVAANAAAAQLLARPASQIVGRKAWDFAPGAEHIWDGVIAAARAADYHGEISIATPEGPRTIHYAVAIRSSAGRSLALVFAIQIHAAADDAAQRLESLGRVAGGIAHDFNNQLVSVLAEASSAREDPSTSSQVTASLRRIEAAAQRMAMLTRQLLAYAGRGRIVSEVIVGDELLAESTEQLQRSVRPDATLVIAPGAPAVTLDVDRGQLREVIVNLVVNASEAISSGGRIRVATTLVSTPARPWWQLEVIDNGAGMDAHTVSQIFDPFFTTKTERHGLGLSAVHGIVRRLSGEIVVDSKPGGGTRFQVRLPVISGQPKVRDTRPPGTRPTSLAGISILVADDEPSVRATVRRLLERRGANVVIAHDGEQAATRLREGKYALVMLDVMMPGLTGFQLLPVARAAQPTAKILLMSGYSDATLSSGNEDEADAFLEKPFTAKQMDDAVDALLAR